MNNSPDTVMKFLEIFRSYKPELKISFATSLIEALLAVEKRKMSFEEIKEEIGVYCESLENLGIDIKKERKS